MITVQDVTEESVWLTVVVDVNALFCLAMAYTAIKNGNGYELLLVGISALVLTVRLILGELSQSVPCTDVFQNISPRAEPLWD